MATFTGICIELYQKHQASFNSKGLLEARRYFYTDADGCDGVSPTSEYPIPVLYDSFNSYYPLLICMSYSVSRDDETTGWEICCNYSSEALTSDSFYSETMSYSAEALDTTKYMRWKTAGTMVDIPISTIYPMLEYVINYKRDYSTGYTPAQDRAAIFSCVGKLNNASFRGFNAETLLFEGAEVNEEKNQLGVVIRAAVTYKFLYRERSHNEVYREARQALDADGKPMYYSAATGALYPPDATHMDGDPVLVGDPVASVSAWDRPFYLDGATTKYRYNTADFATVLGISGS